MTNQALKRITRELTDLGKTENEDIIELTAEEAEGLAGGNGIDAACGNKGCPVGNSCCQSP